jgi:hypothetical protein
VRLEGLGKLIKIIHLTGSRTREICLVHFVLYAQRDSYLFMMEKDSFTNVTMNFNYITLFTS